MTAPPADDSFAAAMEYAAALEAKAHVQTERIIDLEASVDGQTILTEAIDYTESVVTTGGSNKDPKELRVMVKELTESVTAQAATLASLSVKTNSGGGGGGQNIETKKLRPGLHVCVNYKRVVYHK